jgi:polyferredoxin
MAGNGLPNPSEHGSHKPSSVQRTFGLVLFLVGLAVFTGVLLVGDYQLDNQKLINLQGSIPADRLAKLESLNNRLFTSKNTFLRAVAGTINDDGKVQPYQLQQYQISILKAASIGYLTDHPGRVFLASLVLALAGAFIFILAGLREQPGIKNNHIFFSSTMYRGAIGIITGAYLIGFYVLLYWFPEYVVNMIILADPVSFALRNLPADRWFLYGTLYTLAVSVMGIRMSIKYRHSRYHLVRTSSVIFFQFALAWLLPSIMDRLGQPSMDLKNAWPLNYSFFMDWNLTTLLNSGYFGMFLLFWGMVLSLVAVPVLTYFFGKRWYCSWVCGCGGLAETVGDPFRQLSDKSLKAWQVERWLVHSVLVFAVVMTIMQIANFLSDGALFSNYTWRVNQWYSFAIGSAFAGVIGTGFYPLMGNRVWCRFGCPLAAILGIVQKFKSRFVITTNGGQCISCGNCSTYCEMGIDVRWYAQREQNIIRASCVGCGVCAAVCPRGVLRLENGDPNKRYNVVLEDEILGK